MNRIELPLISVLLPVYNVENFVVEAVTSILNQSYRNLEVLIVDDCSSDNTYAKVKQLALEDKRIKLFRNSKNLKIAESLNQAIKNATGDFFVRMDGDDISVPSRIEELYHYLVVNSEVDLVSSNVIVVDEDGVEIEKIRYVEDFVGIKEVMKYGTPIPHFWLCKREVYDTVGLYRIPTVEDLDFLLRCVENGYTLATLQRYLYLQRVRSGNTISASGLVQYKSRMLVRNLEKERRDKNGVDLFTEDMLSKSIKSTKWEEFWYKISALYQTKYMLNKESKIKYLYRLLSVFFAPKKQVLEMLNRSRYKKVVRQYEK